MISLSVSYTTYPPVTLVYLPHSCTSYFSWSYSHRLVKDHAKEIILYGQSVGSGPSCYLASTRPVAGLILHRSGGGVECVYLWCFHIILLSCFHLYYHHAQRILSIINLNLISSMYMIWLILFNLIYDHRIHTVPSFPVYVYSQHHEC